MNKSSQIVQALLPFLFFGVMIVTVILGIILFSYLLILGAVVGVVLFIAARIKEKFFPSKNITSSSTEDKQGRVIDHKDE